MVATPLPDPTDHKNPSFIFAGKTYQGKDAPTFDNFPVRTKREEVENSVSETNSSKGNETAKGKSVTFKDGNSKDRDKGANCCSVVQGSKPMLLRSKSVPASASYVCTDDLKTNSDENTSRIENDVEFKKTSICTQTSILEDPASQFLLSPEASCSNDSAENEEDTCENCKETCKLNIDNDSSDCESRRKRKNRRRRYCYIAGVVFLCVLVAVGVSVAIILFMQKNGPPEDGSGPPPTDVHYHAPNHRCSVLEAHLDNDVVSNDKIGSEYELPFKVIEDDGELPKHIFTKDGRNFRVKEPGWYMVHLTLHLDTWSWRQKEDYGSSYRTTMCAVYGNKQPQCVTKTIPSGASEYISINRPIHIKNTHEKLYFILTVPDSNMIKRSKTQNKLQIHRMC